MRTSAVPDRQAEPALGRRTLLRRLGLTAATIAVPASMYEIGERRGRSALDGTLTQSVVAGQQRGRVAAWWSIDTESRAVALTFDDGPTREFTGEVLDVLARYDAPATFFLIGELVVRHPDLVRRMVDAGHEVGNHTFDHLSCAVQTRAETFRSVERGADVIAEHIGTRPRWLRPVRGHVTGDVMAAAGALGHDLALWSVSRGPLGRGHDADLDGVRAHYLNDVHPGAIVIFHDGIGRSAFEWAGPDRTLIRQRRTELNALPGVIEGYLAGGYELLTVSQLTARRDTESSR